MSSSLFEGAEIPEWLGPPSSFLGLRSPEADFDKARAVIVPAPYDGTTTFRAGTREGPRAILVASRELECYDEETGTEAWRQGIATLDELAVNVASPRDMVSNVRQAGEFVLSAGKLPVLVGGEHLLSLGMIEAIAARYGEFTILHLDAHADLRPSYQGSPYSNACVMFQALKHASLVQVGIRAITARITSWCGSAVSRAFWPINCGRTQGFGTRSSPCWGHEFTSALIWMCLIRPSCPPWALRSPVVWAGMTCCVCSAPYAANGRCWVSMSWNCSPIRTMSRLTSWPPAWSTSFSPTFSSTTIRDVVRVVQESAFCCQGACHEGRRRFTGSEVNRLRLADLTLGRSVGGRVPWGAQRPQKRVRRLCLLNQWMMRVGLRYYRLRILRGQ